MPMRIFFSLILIVILASCQIFFDVKAQELPKPTIPFTTNGMRYDLPMQQGSGNVPILLREHGFFEPLINVFQQELREEYAWCGGDKSVPFTGYACAQYYHVGLPLRLSHNLSTLVIDFIGPTQLGNDFRPVAIYSFRSLLSDGFVFLDHIAVYDMSDSYMQRVVSLPESNALQSKLVTRGLTAKLYQANRADEWVEMYLVVYPKMGIIKGYEGWRPPLKASLLMQAFYPKAIEKEFQQLFMPILNENLWAYANSLKE
jgi:hypothetical protein